MYPVLFHLGPILIPVYGAMAALGVLLALWIAQRTALDGPQIAAALVVGGLVLLERAPAVRQPPSA